ncbi:MAG: hypothetical protein SVK08_00335 [Halobacteriota archaeon]|nr:hypothetical protein [Halobacteriota archaeon]
MIPKFIQQFDKEDRLAHYGKLVIDIGKIIALVWVMTIVVSRIDAWMDQDAKLAEKEQNQVSYEDLGDGSAQSDTEVLKKSDIEKMLAEMNTSIQSRIAETESKVAEVHHLVATGFESYKDQESASVDQPDGGKLYYTPWPRDDASKHYWASFKLPEETFDVDVRTKVSIDLVKAVQVDNNKIRFFAEVTDDYTGEKLDKVETFESSLDRIEFRRSLDRPQWRFVLGGSVMTNGVSKFKIGVERNNWEFYGSRLSNGDFEFGVDRSFNVTEIWERFVR